MRRDRDGLLVSIPEGSYDMEAQYVSDGPVGSGVYLNWYRYAPELRRRGLGRKYYEAWEATLPEHVERIYLHSLDTAIPFWTRMGYEPVYRHDPDENNLMVKELRGRHAPIEYDAEDLAYYEHVWLEDMEAMDPATTKSLIQGSMREALQAEQVELFDDFEARPAQVIPSWEEVWKYYTETYTDWADAQDDWIADSYPDEFRAALEEILEENGIGAEPGTEEWDDEAELYRDDAAFRVMLEIAEDEFRDRYDEALYRIEESLDEETCWRMMVLAPETDPTRLINLGIYWAYEEDGADAYCAANIESGRKVRYEAMIDPRNIDTAGTIWANTHPLLGEREKEVRFFSNAPIFVYSVDVFEPGHGCRLDETVVINGWRRT